MSHTREAILSVAERSPAAVAVHDRAAWLDLFSHDAVVEDPVGSAPAPKANGTLGRFWDTFIAPHVIRFEIRRDHFLGDAVFRDAIIHTTVQGVKVQVPAYLLYEVVERDGHLYARRMAAHWTLMHMTGVAMSLGPRAWVAMTGLFARIVKIMGPAWVADYLASMWRGIGARGVQSADYLAAAIASRDESRARDLFTANGFVEYANDRRETPDAFVRGLPASTRLRIDAAVSAGWTTSFRYVLEGTEPREGLALLEFDLTDGRIGRARFFAA